MKFEMNLVKYILSICTILILIREQTVRGTFEKKGRSLDSLYSLIPGRYPDCVSLPQVLSEVPNTPEGRAWVQKFAEDLSKQFGIPIPDAFVDLFFEDSSILLDLLSFTGEELLLGTEALELAYDAGLISNTKPKVDVLPNGFDLKNAESFPLNLSYYLPPLKPVQVLPNLWQGFFRGKAPISKIHNEIVWSLALNQLANNSHLTENDSTRFSVVYNGKSFDRIEDLMMALYNNGHNIKSWLTWRAVDFFGYQTKVEGKFKMVPVPIMLNTDVSNRFGAEAIAPAIHDEFVISISPGPKSNGTTFNGDILWYEGDNAIGFFARDLYSLSSWVGTVNSDFMDGLDTINLVHLMGLFSDALLESAIKFHLYNLGYSATGVCVDSTNVLELVVYGNMTLYPLLMEKSVVLPILQNFIDVDNKNQAGYKQLLEAVQKLTPDYTQNPTLCRRALLSLPWEEGKEPFQTAIDARNILQTQCKV